MDKPFGKEKKKIVAVASFGGHWIQLLRLTRPMHPTTQLVYVSTSKSCASMVPENHFYCLSDFSRWNAWRLLPVFCKALSILRRERPDAVLTTGAAPGLVVVMAARMLGIKTIWLDSIANAAELSMCGKWAARIASVSYTQWPHLAVENVKYAGNVLGADFTCQ